MNKTSKHYTLPCVKCPFCKEIVEAQVTEENNIRTIVCSACNECKTYPIESLQ